MPRTSSLPSPQVKRRCATHRMRGCTKGPSPHQAQAGRWAGFHQSVRLLPRPTWEGMSAWLKHWSSPADPVVQHDPADYEPFAIALRRCFIACSGAKGAQPRPRGPVLRELQSTIPWTCCCAASRPTPWTRSAAVRARPADIVAGLQQFDGHPSADEAWAMSLAAADERATVVWTMPMAMAWDIARHAYWDNRVAAALAFKGRPTRAEVQRHRNAGQPAKWIVCLGFDKASTKHAIEQALAKGLITNESLSHEQRALLALPPSERLLGIAGAAAQPLEGSSPSEPPVQQNQRRE